MNTKPIFVFVFCSTILLFSFAGPAKVSPTYAIVDCKIIPVSSTPVEKGVIIIRNGLIESIGSSERSDPPEDAEVIKAEGLCAYPGLIDAHTHFFLEAPKEERQPARTLAAGAQQLPEKDWAEQVEIMAFKLLKPKKSDIEELHKAGITTVLVAPEKGIFTGQSVLVNINGEEKEPMVIQNPIALHVNFITERGRYPSSLMGTMAFLKQSFLDTEYYSSYKSRFWESSLGMKRLSYDPYLEALFPYIVQKKPVFFNCANQEDIKRALRLIKEFKLNGFLTGANEAWRVADHIKEANVHLLISLDFKPPSTSIYFRKGEEIKKKAEEEIYPTNPASLHKQEIPFALTSLGIQKASDIVKNIQKAIKAGLPKDEALKAMTIVPARMLGVSSFMGDLEPGKIANIILTDGQIFDEKTKVKRVFVDGLSFEIKEPPKGVKPAVLNVTGRWRAVISGPMGEMGSTMELAQEGSSISGHISSNFGKWEISDGVLSGNELSFIISAVIMGETMEMSFTGTAEKDSIEGTVSFEGGIAELRATRIPDKSV